MLRRTLGTSIEIELEIEDDLILRLDSSQLENALLNLSLNARDAMKGEGTITMAAHRLSDGETVPKGEEGQWATIQVTDQGPGMPDDVIEHAFEPFFTTKDTGGGSGLGLSMVHGFVTQSGGTVRIDSVEGEGTTIVMTFPIEADVDERDRDTEVGSELRGGDETILVAEDEARVRKFAVRILKGLGYEILEAQNSSEALKILGDGAEVDLIFSDIVMPGGVNGRELAKIVAEKYPDIKVQLTTGHSRGAKNRNQTDDPLPADVLRKPYSKEVVARRIRELLDG